MIDDVNFKTCGKKWMKSYIKIKKCASRKKRKHMGCSMWLFANYWFWYISYYFAWFDCSSKDDIHNASNHYNKENV